MNKSEPFGKWKARSLLKEIEDQNWLRCYKNHNRLIEKELWEKLKAKRECDKCHAKVNYRMEIHHRIAVSRGGSNEEENLEVLCGECHPKEDKKADPIRTPKIDWHNPPYYDLSKSDKPRNIIKPISEGVMMLLTELKEILKKAQKEIEIEELNNKPTGIGSIKGQLIGLITLIEKAEQKQKQAKQQEVQSEN